MGAQVFINSFIRIINSTIPHDHGRVVIFPEREIDSDMGFGVPMFGVVWFSLET